MASSVDSSGADLGGRPRGEVRLALARAGEALAREHGGWTWRDVAQAACVGFAVARQTVENMERAGELECVGQRHVPGVCRPMNVYAPRRASEPAARISLDQAMRGWVRGQACTEPEMKTLNCATMTGPRPPED